MMDTRGAIHGAGGNGGMDGTLIAGASNELLDEPMSEGTGAARSTRRRIDTPERQVLDDRLADRLDRLGMDPWLPTVTGVTVMHNGHSFDLTPLRQHWGFAGNAKSKAADFTTEFMAFRQVTNTSTFQGFVLRPELRKGGPGELLETINRVSSDYSNVMTAAVKDGLARPIATFIHIRYDVVLQMWDVHLHVVADVPKIPMSASSVASVDVFRRRRLFSRKALAHG